MATRTRPDIAFSTSNLNKYTSNPSLKHFQTLKQTHRYLLGTRLDLQYSKMPNTSIVQEIHPRKEINLKVFSDSDWANNKDDHHSTTGYLFKITGGPISWASRHQKTVAISSTKTKYMTLSEAARKSKWITKLIKDLNFQIQSPITIHYNNKSTITIAETKGIKHC